MFYKVYIKNRKISYLYVFNITLIIHLFISRSKDREINK